MPYQNVAAQDYLVQSGALSRRTAEQGYVFTCIACRWAMCAYQGHPLRVYGYEVGQCLDLTRPTVYRILTRLEGFVLASLHGEAILNERDNQIAPLRKYYEPLDTPLGQTFRRLLEVPEYCPLQCR